MKKIYFYVNETKVSAKSALRALSADAALNGLEMVQNPSSAEIIISVGGDGTILKAVRQFPRKPIIGFNFGGLGYLSSVEKGGFFSALKALAENRYSISERTMLEVSKNEKETFRALNDVVIMRVMSGHATVLDLSVDGHLPTRYTADGLIIATPTGSTAYSLSAGGPVLMNDSASFVVTPMNPHALGIRSMVVSDKSVFSVTSCARTSGHEKTCVYVDGETAFMLEEGETAEIRKSSETTFIVSLEEHDPYAVLSKKLGWSGSSIK